MDGREPEASAVWPPWGRRLFWTAFLLVLALAAFAAFRDGLDLAAVRAAGVVVVVPGLAVLAFGLNARRTAHRSLAELERGLAEAGRLIDHERTQSPAERSSTASDGSLARASSARHHAVGGTASAPVTDGLVAVERLVSEAAAWRRPSPAADAVDRCDRAARNLARALDRAARARR